MFSVKLFIMDHESDTGSKVEKTAHPRARTKKSVVGILSKQTEKIDFSIKTPGPPAVGPRAAEKNAIFFNFGA